MPYSIAAIELYVRETQPGRMLFSLGKQKADAGAKQGLVNPLGHVRLILRDSTGHETFGCSGDRLSVRWLDKRPGRSQDLKRRELVSLIEFARHVSLTAPEFETPFELWRQVHPVVMAQGRKMNQEDLTSSFAAALFERAVLDAYCRAEGVSFFEAVKQDRLGFQPQVIHPQVGSLPFPEMIRPEPLTQFFIRHTVGSSDPLTDAEITPENRIGDGLPESLEGYVREDGLRYFKVKVSGDAAKDLERLGRIWDVIVDVDEPVVTLDANEAYSDLDSFAEFLTQFEMELTGLFQHVEYIEQPLPRALTLDPSTSQAIHKLAERKPLLIDEADGSLNAYKQALDIGYGGTSHKNCKGVFKSLCNYALMFEANLDGRHAFMSAEDLQNLPMVPLQQDFTTLGVLGIEHCERNGHHYNYGLSMLSEKDKANAARLHKDLYTRKGDELFLNIRQGQVACSSLQCDGFGVASEPDWASMQDMRAWTNQRHPA